MQSGLPRDELTPKRLAGPPEDVALPSPRNLPSLAQARPAVRVERRGCAGDGRFAGGMGAVQAEVY